MVGVQHVCGTRPRTGACKLFSWNIERQTFYAFCPSVISKVTIYKLLCSYYKRVLRNFLVTDALLTSLCFGFSQGCSLWVYPRPVWVCHLWRQSGQPIWHSGHVVLPAPVLQPRSALPSWQEQESWAHQAAQLYQSQGKPFHSCWYSHQLVICRCSCWFFFVIIQFLHLFASCSILA